MNNLMTYKGYNAAIQYSEEDDILIGHIVGINDLLYFHGHDVSELKENFKNTVHEYLAFCKEVNKQPEKEYKGVFNVRVSPDLHRDAVLCAAANNESLNQFVKEAIQERCLVSKKRNFA